jgi:hypothetical protein
MRIYSKSILSKFTFLCVLDIHLMQIKLNFSIIFDIYVFVLNYCRKNEQ